MSVALIMATSGKLPGNHGAGRHRGWRAKPLGRQIHQILVLFGGSFAAALMGFAAFALTARALGPEQYGVLAMLYAYIRSIERLVSFQSWQPLIRYGAHAQTEGRTSDVASLLKFSFLLDVAGALVACCLASGGALLASAWFQWSPEREQAVLLYSLTLAFGLSGMPTGVLRLAGRFGRVAILQMAVACLRLCLCAIGAWADAGFAYFLAVWACMQIASSMALLSLAAAELRRDGIVGAARASLAGLRQRFPNIWGFAWSANLSLTLRASTNEVDTLLVGALAGAAAGGVYQIAKRMARMAQQFGQQVQAVVYPDLARSWSRASVAAFRRNVLQLELLLVSLGLVGVAFAAIAAEPLLRWTAGPEFLGAAPLLLVQMVAVMLTLTGVSLRSALLAMGAQDTVLRAAAVGTGLFFVVAVALVPMLGPMGANTAHVVLGATNLAWLALALRRKLRASLHAVESPAPAPAMVKG